MIPNSNETSPEETSTMPEFSQISPDAIARLFAEGDREKNHFLRIVGESREALARMPRGRRGFVIGSGPNTQGWKSRGWKTLDIEPGFNPDIVVDANWMEKEIPAGSQDFIYSEYLTFDKRGLEGVTPSRLLEQSNKALKPGGKLIINTAHSENYPNSSLPDRKEYAKLLQKHGFRGITELGKIEDRGNGWIEQPVIYYAEKVRGGFVEIDD